MRAILLFHMRIGLLAVLGFMVTAGCQNSDVHFKVLIGATTVTALGAAPIPDSVIVIAADKIRSVGLRKDVPVPQNSDRTDLTGKWVVPSPGTTIERGQTANLLVLDHAPGGVTPLNASDVGARLVAGEWKTQ